MRRVASLLGLVVVAVLMGASFVHGQEQTWDVDTLLESDLTTSFIFQDSALLDAPKKMLCPKRMKMKIVAVSLPPEACKAVLTHAQQNGCGMEESPVVFFCK